MNPILKAYERDMSTAPNWTPSPDVRERLMLRRVAEELRQKVTFSEPPDRVLWDRLFISEDRMTVGVRTDFGGNPAGVFFRFNERAEPVSVRGRGVNEIRFIHDLPVEGPDDKRLSASPAP